MNNLAGQLFRHRYMPPVLLFFTVFVIYFSSSSGLINSGDTPQYFTTEALIRYGNVNIKPFYKDPHFFIWPDYYVRGDEVLSFRGYGQSLVMIPLHLAADAVFPLLSTSNFPLAIQSANFRFELAVTSLFTLFTVAGVLILYLLMKEMTGSQWISFIFSLLFALGTYAWKYSSYYTRHGILILISSLILMSLWRIIHNGKGLRWRTLLFCCLAISFTIDVIFFIARILILGLFTLYELISSDGRKGREIIFGSVPGTLMLRIFVLLNIHWYGTVSPNQSQMSSQFDGIPYEKRLQTMMGAPLIPSLFTLLFGFGPPPQSAFSHTKTLPAGTQTYISVKFAREYNFFGLFSVSPFLLFSFLFPFWKLKRPILVFLLLAFGFFALNIAGNAKFYAFWGGNQYDIRYIYTHAVFLLPLLATCTKWYFHKFRKGLERVFFIALFSVAGAWSLFMGWLGQINMFAPALQGERKIWMDPLTFYTNFRRFSMDEYLNATFINRENAITAVFVGLVMLFAYYLVERFTGKSKQDLCR